MYPNLQAFLEETYQKFNKPDFIANDPIQIPHRYTRLQDIEITAFWTAILAWGQRKTIIGSATQLFSLMDNAPHDFILNHEGKDRKRFLDFKHRTFQPTDTLYFLEFLQAFYNKNSSLESAFARHISQKSPTIEPALIGFRTDFFDLPDAPDRAKKHIATPLSGSTCKRLNMFLRWMVRQDKNGVDFGIWKEISPAQLLIPLDIHVDRQARRLGLLTRPKTDWQAVLELTENLRTFDQADPTRFDFSLFGLGIAEKDVLKSFK
jgi:uncharacterized protein (TIGR02757 family)